MLVIGAFSVYAVYFAKQKVCFWLLISSILFTLHIATRFYGIGSLVCNGGLCSDAYMIFVIFPLSSYVNSFLGLIFVFLLRIKTKLW